MRLAPKAAGVAGTVRAMIADGTLKPGQAAPAAKTLQEKTGAGRTYCLLALKSLEEDGVLARAAHGWTVRAKV